MAPLPRHSKPKEREEEEARTIQADMEEREEEDEEPRPKKKESLINIAASRTKSERKKCKYALNLDTNEIHLVVEGTPELEVICWDRFLRNDRRRVKKRYIAVSDPGTNPLCRSCAGWAPKPEKEKECLVPFAAMPFKRQRTKRRRNKAKC